jgi:hypothetical protein
VVPCIRFRTGRYWRGYRTVFGKQHCTSFLNSTRDEDGRSLVTFLSEVSPGNRGYEKTHNSEGSLGLNILLLVPPFSVVEINEKDRCFPSVGAISICLMSVTPIPVDIYVPLVEEILDEAERHFLGLTLLCFIFCVHWGCLLVKIKNISPTNVTMEDIAIGA